MEFSFPVILVLFWYCVRVSCKELDNKKATTIDATQDPRKISKDIMSKIIPMLVGPFMMQTLLTPIRMIFLKFVLANSIFIGKLGILLWIFNIIRNKLDTGGGLYSHNINVKHNDHQAHQYQPQNGGLDSWRDDTEEFGYRRKKRR